MVEAAQPEGAQDGPVGQEQAVNNNADDRNDSDREEDGEENKDSNAM